MASRKTRTPIVEYLDEPALCYLFRDFMLYQPAQACASSHGGSGEKSIIDDQLSLGTNSNLTIIAHESPWTQPAAAHQAIIDADVGLQISRYPGLAMTIKIVRRAYDYGADVRLEPYCNHVAVNLLAEADAGIKTFGHYIDRPVVGDYLHRHIGMFQQKGWKPRCENRSSAIMKGRKSHSAGWSSAPVCQRREATGHFGKGRIERSQEALPCGRGRDRPRGSRQQKHTQALFQIAHCMAESGRG
ncbi:hypothetical protein GCM10027214_17280 [Stenotrophomonas tumulicola]